MLGDLFLLLNFYVEDLPLLNCFPFIFIFLANSLDCFQNLIGIVDSKLIESRNVKESNALQVIKAIFGKDLHFLFGYRQLRKKVIFFFTV